MKKTTLPSWYTYVLVLFLAFSFSTYSQTTLFDADFETLTGDNAWTVSDIGSGGNTWFIGTESTALSGADGDYAYSERNGSDEYEDDTYLLLESSSIDLTGYERLTFSIDVWYDTEASYDGMRIDYSTDGGTNYYQLGDDDGGTNWYDDVDIDGIFDGAYGWAGNSGGWLTATFDLHAQAFDNQSDVRIRITFASDGSNAEAGVAVDNVTIEGYAITAKTYPTCGPAGIGNNLELWLKADSQIGTYTNGASVDTWTDSAFGSTWTNATSAGTERPTFYDNAADNVNFNPVIQFDGNDAMYGRKGFYNDEIFLVVKPSALTTAASATQDVFCGDWHKESPGTEDITGIAIGNTSARFANDIVAYNQGANVNYGKGLTSTTLGYDNVVLFNARKNAANTGMDLFFDGLDLAVFGPTVLQEVNAGTYEEIQDTRYWLGRSEFWGASLQGDVLEVIVYSSRLTDAERQRVEGYLAVKYGIALGFDGTSGATPHLPVTLYDSTHTALWDTTVNAGYTYNMAAIGRDDCSTLNQKQSTSVDPGSVITISLGDTYSTNSSNPNSFTDDLDFLVWGSNGSALTAAATPISVNLGPTTVTTLTDVAERRWKITERATTDIGVVEVSVATADLVNLPALVGNDAYVMILADDAAFSTGVETVFLETEGANQTAKYDFDGTKFFTFGVAHETLADRHLEFDGVDNFANIGDKVDLTGPFSISAWVYTTGSNSTNNAKTIISKRGGPSNGYLLYLRDDNFVQMNFDSGSINQITSNTAIPLNQWRHIAFSYDGADARIYIDGVLDNTEAMNAPTANSNSLCIGARYIDKNTQANFFMGNIEEIRIWNQALSVNEIRYIMNQEIEQDGGGNVDGEILPLTTTKNDINGVPWSDLLAYFNMNSYIGTHLNDVSGNGNRASLVVPDNFSIRDQTAPLPYVTTTDSNWTATSTWENGSEMYVPNSSLTINGVATDINWNIVQLGHDVAATDDKTVLGLISTANELSVESDSNLTVTHYLELDGVIDLVGESQLIQETDSDLAVTSAGYIERDQQGIADNFTYNYWGLPVGNINTSSNNAAISISSAMRDGTSAGSPLAITFDGAAGGADGAPTSPITLSSYWMYRFIDSAADDYNGWNFVGDAGSISIGEGFTMKGPGTGGVADEQNFVFVGKPNNGTITLPLSNGNEYLVGNPYPSAIDADLFIADNTSTDGSVRFWQHFASTSHIVFEYQGGYALYNLSGGTPAVSHPDIDQTGSGTKTPTRYIPVAQGFFVVDDTTNPVAGNITFENDQRVFRTEASASSVFIRNSEETESTSIADDRTKIRLGFDSPGELHRQLLLTIDENTTNGIDWAYDARKNEVQYDDMFWMLENDKYVIQAIPFMDETQELPLGVDLTYGGRLKIAIDAFENMPEDIDVFIKDNSTGTLTNLRTNDFEIDLPVGEYHDRFVLTFGNTVLSVDENNLEENLNVHYLNGLDIIRIQSNGNVIPKDAVLYNMLGQKVRSWEAIEVDQDLSTKGISTGNYIFNLHTDQGIIAKKFSIK